MGITVRWNDQTDQQLDAIEVYRGSAALDENNPGEPLVVLGADATEFEDTTVQVGNVYFYTVAVVKGNNRSFGASQSQGYFSSLGPGPQKVLRGDWVRGYFGEIRTVEFVTMADVAAKMKDQFKSTTGITFATNTTAFWYKFIYKGKILFIPNAHMITSNNWQNGYNAGFIYGTDDFGDSPTGAPGAVNQQCIIEVGGQQYLARSIRLSDKPVSQYLTDPLDFNDGEWKSTYARLRADPAALTDPTIQPRFSDLGSINGTGSPHMADATNLATVSTNAPETLTKAGKTSSTNWMVVLELLA